MALLCLIQLGETSFPTLESILVINLSLYVIFMHECVYGINLSATLTLSHVHIHFFLKVSLKHVLNIINHAYHHIFPIPKVKAHIKSTHLK